jgi:hypothetical protein
MPDKTDKIAGEIDEQKKASYDWMKSNFYDQWFQVFQSYLCEREPERDPNDVQPRKGQQIYGYDGRLIPRGTIDLGRTSIGMPDTWALVRRMTARITAQLPNLNFRANDFDRADRVSRRLMHQWDKAGVQRTQKKHVQQSVLFGWSVRAWSWWENTVERTRRVDPFGGDPQDLDLIHKQYADDIEAIVEKDEDIRSALEDEEAAAIGWEMIFGDLLAKKGRGGLLPVKYDYTAYAGPRADFLMVADCFPEPNLENIQSSNHFIVERRRKRSWLKAFRKWAEERGEKALAKGIGRLLTDKPKGSVKSVHGLETQEFRQRMNQALDRTDTQVGEPQKEDGAEWVITERHKPGSSPKLAMACEGIFLGEIDYPYELEGRIAFSELVLIDSLLDGIGDSTARAIRGLQHVHDRQVCARVDLVDNIQRPLVWTTSQRLYENPELLRRHGGMRLVLVEEPNEIGVMGEQAAIAAAAAGLQDESGILRLIQLATGETNMSMAANVDPQQARTATGARIMAFNQDILSRDVLEMYNLSLREDSWIMYLMNRSEMAEPVEFDEAPYIRQTNQQQAPPQQSVVEVTPADFQVDGEIDVEVGSTLADDDESRTTKAQTTWGIASSSPNLFNMNAVRDEVLKALGYGNRLHELAAPPQPPPEPEKPRANVTVSFKGGEDLTPEQKELALAQANLVPEQPPEQPPPGGPDAGMSPFGPMPELAEEGPPDAAGAFAASRGGVPVG